jgi:hypothetical protein
MGGVFLLIYWFALTNSLSFFSARLKIQEKHLALLLNGMLTIVYAFFYCAVPDNFTNSFDLTHKSLCQLFGMALCPLFVVNTVYYLWHHIQDIWICKALNLPLGNLIIQLLAVLAGCLLWAWCMVGALGFTTMLLLMHVYISNIDLFLAQDVSIYDFLQSCMDAENYKVKKKDLQGLMFGGMEKDGKILICYDLLQCIEKTSQTSVEEWGLRGARYTKGSPEVVCIEVTDLVKGVKEKKPWFNRGWFSGWWSK